MEDRLQLDNGLMPSKIVPILLQESALKELLEKQLTESPRNLASVPLGSTGTEIVLSGSSPCERSADPLHAQCRKASLLVPDARRRLEERRGSEPLHSTRDLEPAGHLEKRSLGNHHHMEGHGHHLHLSSCHECLELENSTILSVKYASAENIPDLPADGDETLDEFEDDAKGFRSQSSRVDSTGKPPNVLVFTGGCQQRFQTIRQLLMECVNMERYVIYPLQPQQALSEPWLDNATLLVLAEEETLTPQLQTRFLTYLGQGGRVLGLASTLCPAGLALEARERPGAQVGRLSFTREDNTELELSVLTSGKVFIRDSEGGGEVELWGELKGEVLHGERDMVIVRVTHGEDGGEAVLCQVHLEMPPDSPNVTPEGFDELKVSNARRYEVLTEILTSLGLSCELNQAPAPSPVYLLSTSPDILRTPGSALSPLRDILRTPGSALSPLQEILRTPGSALSPLQDIPRTPGSALSPLQDIPRTPGSALSPLQDISRTPGSALSPLQDILRTPGSALSPLQDILRTPGSALSPLQEILRTPGSALSPLQDILRTPRSALSPLQDILRTPGSALSPLQEILRTPGSALSPLQEILRTPRSALSLYRTSLEPQGLPCPFTGHP
ncbi:biotin--protein ligase-like [Diretmus argenteus]